MSVVLDDIPSGNYEPSEAELLEYGKWLGMEFPADKPFLWIAREGLRAPLPENWKACRSDKGDLYYFNFKTGESIWDHPMDEHFKELLRSEKENPGPQSVANGAKKKPFLSKTAVETAAESSPSVEQKYAFSGGKTKMQTLKTLKQSKQLPDDLMFDVEGAKNSTSDTSIQSFEELNTAGSVDGAKCLTVKSPTVVPPSEKEGDSLTSNKEVFLGKLNDRLRLFQGEKLKEHQAAKDEYELKLRESWARTRKRLDEEYENKTNTLKDNLEKKLCAEKSRLEGNYATDIQQLRGELASQFEKEAKRMHGHLSDKRKMEEHDVEKRWQSEMEDLRRAKAIEYEKLCALNNRIMEEMKNSTMELGKTATDFIDIYRKAHASFCGALTEANTMHSKQCETALGQLLDRAKETYDAEIANVKNCYYIEIEQMRRTFAEEIRMLQQNIRELTDEKQRYEKATEKVSVEELESFNVVNTELPEACAPKQEEQGVHDSEQLQLPLGKTAPLSKMEGQERTIVSDTTDTRSEREVFQTFIAFMRESQMKELEDVKKDLKRQAEEELRSVLDEIARERRRVLDGFIPGEGDKTLSLQGTATVPMDLKTGDKESEGSITVSPEILRKDDLTALLTTALRAVLPGSPLIFSCMNRDNPAGKPLQNVDTNVGSHAIKADAVQLGKRMEGFPISFMEQKNLLASERQRIGEGKNFVESQRISLEKRRSQLKVTRHQWKLDVMAAKQEGVRSSSRHGQLLNKVRVALENQSKGLEHDEAILRDSERWLLMKEQMICQMEQQIKDLEGAKIRDMSTNSMDTVILANEFFNPRGVTADMFSEGQYGIQGAMQTGILSSVCTKTLDRIARRLDEVTSMMNLQHRKRAPSLSCRRMQRRRSEQRSMGVMDFIVAERQGY